MKAPLILSLLAVPALVAAQAPAPVKSADPGATFEGLQYRSLGPTRGGRVTAVAGHAAEPNTFYFGSTGGGVWKSTDAGETWTNISDGYFATGSIGAIDVADSNKDIVYVGTGSAAIRSNVIIGKGVYKSTDAGRTWTHVGLKNAGQINTLIVHPTNPDIVFVAALGNPFAPNPERGVFRTRDGGKSWEKVLFVSDSTGASDIAINPSNPNEIYAGMWRGERKPWTITSGAREGGVYKSTDGGTTWKKLTAGLPKGLTGKIALDVAASQPNTVYALIEAVGDENGLYRSDDAGATWRHVSNQNGLLNRPFYYTYVNVDPKNPEKVWVNNESYFLSMDGGKTFEVRRTPHGDNHGMWINPNNPDIYIQSNDGGVNVTKDGGRTWTTQDNQPTAEIYQVAVDNRFPYNVYGAQQDNTTLMINSAQPLERRTDTPGCETGPIAPHPLRPDTVYGACKGHFSRQVMSVGQEVVRPVAAMNIYGHNPKDLPYRFQRVAPMHISPHDPNTIYFGSQFVHRTRDEGVTWETISPDLTANDPRGHVPSGSPITRDITGEEYYSTLYAIAESPLQKGLIWAGANDGPIHVSRDDGKTWTNVTPKQLPKGGRVQTIEPSPHKPGKAYVTVLLYMLDDWRPHVYRTTDYGASWTLITNGIPADYPARVIREDPKREGLLYLGTEFGMFVSHDDGANWLPFQMNLPVTPITDMVIKDNDLVLSTMGRGFWVLDNLGAVRQWNAGSRTAAVTLFAPDAAYRVRASGSGRGGANANPDWPQNRPAGAAIDYYINGNVRDLRIEIVGANGAVVRSYSAADAPRTPAEPDRLRANEDVMRQGPPPRGPAAPAPTRNPGFNRFYWDFSTMVNDRPGPVAVPGDYTVRLIADGSTQTQPLRVLIDPRVEADGITVADLREQYDFVLKVQELSAEANRVLQDVRTRIQSARQANASARVTELEKVMARLTQQTGIRYPQPMLVQQISNLSGVVSRGDQKIPASAKQRLSELTAELDSIKRQLSGI